jgi:hypothetical protein
MIKRTFTAQIIDDFKTHWLAATAKDENMTIEEVENAYSCKELDDLNSRISGQRVTLIENEYIVGNNDFFEKDDNNFVIHRCLFAEI